MARRPVNRPRRSWAQRAVLSAGSVSMVVLLLAAGTVSYAYWRYGQIRRLDVLLSPTRRSAATGSAGPAQNFLIAGSDSRASISANDPTAGAFLAGTSTTRAGLSDTIVLLHIDPSKRQAVMLSFPRDLWVPIAGTTHSAKINSAFSIGPQTLIDTIEQDFNIPVNHFLDVDFAGFKSIINAVGGVAVWFDTPMRDSNSGLYVPAAGCLHMDGSIALSFARSRHLEYLDSSGAWVSDNANDFGRIQRQQLLIRKAITKAESDGLSNPLELNDLVAAGVHNVSLDGTFGFSDLVRLAQRFRTFDAKHLVSYTLPATDQHEPDGEDALQLDQGAAAPLLDLFRGDATTYPSPSDVNVEVLNGTTQPHAATNGAAALQQLGFKIVGIGDTGPAARTEVRYAKGDLQLAVLLARHLTTGAELITDPNATSGTVTLVEGSDFTTVQARLGPTPPTNTVARTARSTTSSVPTGMPPQPGDDPRAKLPDDTPPAGTSCK